jgi:autotransporter-associated beta strand protein
VPIFGSFELLANNTVFLDTPRTISGLTFGDTNPTSAASWLIDDGGNPANVLTLDTSSGVPNGTVNTLGTGATATLAMSLAGTDGIAKSGPGTLILTRPNTLTGVINVNAGILRLAAGSILSSGTGTGTLGTNSQLHVAGGTLTYGGLVTAVTSSLVVDSGTVALNGGFRTNSDFAGTLRLNGGTLTATDVNIRRTSGAAPDYSVGFVVTGGTATVNTIWLGNNNSNGAMSIEGGSVTATGAITIGNNAGSARGGGFRITGGSFVSTDTVSGLVLTRAAGNVTAAAFSGGISTIELISFGFNNAVTTGSGTLTINGGSLYLGSGGLVRNATDAYASVITLQSGLLGAKADWSSALPLTLPAGGNISFKTADAANAPFNIALSGVLSGAGGFTKTGGGTLTLTAANTYTGTTIVDAGTLRVDGSLAAGSAVVINTAATLTGTGAVNGPITLNGGAFQLGGSAADVLLNANNLTWTGGGILTLDVGANGASDRLILAGTLTKGGPGSFALALNATAGFAVGNTYTLATFASTDFSVGDFIVTGLPSGFAGELTLSGTSLQVTIIGTPFITSAGNAAGTYGAPFNYIITAGNDPVSFSASALPAGLNLDVLTGIISGVPVESGSFNVILGATNIAGTGNAPLALTVEKTASTLALGSLKQYYDGTPRHATAVTNPAGLNVTFTYDGESTAPTLPGTYAVSATIDDPDYQGTVDGTLVVTITGLVRHAPTMNGSIDGSLQVLLPESFALNGQSFVAGDLLVPGTPTIRLNGHPTLVGTLDGPGSATPLTHTITLNGNVIVRYIVRHVDPLAMPTVPAPNAPAGTRSVNANNSSTVIGNFATIRNLTLNGNVGQIPVPAGAYDSLSANGGSGFILGTAGATEPSVYHLQHLTLNGNATLRVAGPVILRLANGLNLNGNAGAAIQPNWLIIELSNGGLTLNGNATLHGNVIAPNGSIIINGNATLTGTVSSDRLILNSNSLLAQPAQ